MMLLFWVILVVAYFLGPSIVALAVFNPELFAKIVLAAAFFVGSVWWQYREN